VNIQFMYKNGWLTIHEPPMKGGQNEALWRTYSEVVQKSSEPPLLKIHQEHNGYN
jgi:hypothetical protein